MKCFQIISNIMKETSRIPDVDDLVNTQAIKISKMVRLECFDKLAPDKYNKCEHGIT